MKPTLEIIALIAALIAIALLADAWRSARKDSAQLATTLTSQNAVILQAGEREKQRDAQLSTALSAISTQKGTVHTPQEAASAIPSVLPPLPLPVSIHFPDLTAAPKPNDDLPATISVPQVDLKPLYDDLQDCRATTLDTDAIKKDLADEKLKSASLQHERDTAVAVAHGGTFWARVRREAKWFAIGIAIGAAATAAHR